MILTSENYDKGLYIIFRLKSRFLPGKRFPDKAIDLIDDAAARKRLLSPAEEAANNNLRGDTDMFRSLVVNGMDIAKVVSTSTGIPLSLLGRYSDETESAPDALDKELQFLEERLCCEVVGQQAAVRALVGAIRLSRAGLGRPDRPLGVFLLLGSSGVGKTELAKQISKFVFPTARSGSSGSDRDVADGDEDFTGAMLRLDMSEVAHSVKLHSKMCWRTVQLNSVCKWVFGVSLDRIPTGVCRI